MSRYQTVAVPATHQVLTAGVRNRGWISPKRLGRACRRAMDSAVREAGMIVVWVEASAEVATATRTIQSQPPRASWAREAKTASSSSACAARKPVPA